MSEVAALVECRLDFNPLGLPSRALKNLAGRPVLARTVERLLECGGVEVVGVVAPVGEGERLRPALDGVGVAWFDLAGPDIPRRGQLRRARKWSLDGWRGGLLGATVFDEVGHPALLAAAEKLGADILVPVSAEWPLLDSDLLDAALEHHLSCSGPFGFTISQAPPGLLPGIFSRQRLTEWYSKGIAPADILRYSPDAPRIDFLLEPCGFQVPGELLACEWRLSAETSHGLALLGEVVRALGEDCEAVSVCRYLREHPSLWSGPLPREVELELTTRRPVEDLLRPLPAAEDAEMPIEAALRLVEEVACGEVLLTFGGRGDPLLYPHLTELLRAARRAGVFGLHLVTYGRNLTSTTARLLVECGVDVITFLLDAHTPATYARTKGGADLEGALAGLRRLSEARRASGADWPIPVVEFLKTRLTLPEMEAFYDDWLRRGAWPIIRGPSDRAGQVEDLAVISMAPPGRGPCRRLFRRLFIQATGEVPSCEEDLLCRQRLGDAFEEGIAGVWRGSALQRLRSAHIEGRWGALAVCSRCREWHRP